MMIFCHHRRTAVSLSLVAALVWLTPPRLGEAQTPPPSGNTDGAYRGYLAVRPVAGSQTEVLDHLNGDSLFVPASVLKVLTVAATLEHLGADYRWRTGVTAVGSITGTVLDGDLVLEPGADPTWGDALPADADHPLTVLAHTVSEHGLTRVTGDLVIDLERFPGRRHPTDRSYGDLPYRHATPTAAAAVDEATITLRVAPGPSLGAPGIVNAPDGLEVINHTTTVGRARHGAGTLDFVPVWGTDTLLLRGEYPISEPAFTVSASDPTPEHRVARRFRQTLAEAGVTVDGAMRLQRPGSRAQGQRTLLAEYHSRPLRQIVETILTRSHNWYADMLVLTLALEVAGSGRFADGVDVVSDFVRGLDPALPRGLWIFDGSGLSPSNLVTPETVVRVIGHALSRPWGQTLIEALARPGVGTLGAWPPVPPVVAKTGTLRHTVALAGILDPGSDAPIIFCYFVNHHPERRYAARTEIARALRRWRAPR